MIAFDDSRWPLVAVTRDGEVTLADATAQIIALDNLLRRREPFALLVTDTGAEPTVGDGDQGPQGIATRWLTANHELLHTWCRAIAIVGQPNMDSANEPFAAIGSPLAHFADEASSEAWLSERLSDGWSSPAEAAASA